jgi:hypothetical protein
VQSLDEATVEERDPLMTVYRCRNGCATPILLLTPPAVLPGARSGYHLKDWMVRNPSDLLVHRPECTAVSLIFPASPHALERVALSSSTS